MLLTVLQSDQEGIARPRFRNLSITPFEGTEHGPCIMS